MPAARSTNNAGHMDAVIVYESMFGDTRRVAEALAKGMAPSATVTLINVNDAGKVFPKADLVLVGGPTHVHGLSRPMTRAEAVEWTKDPDRHLTLEKSAPGIGIREWLDELTGPVGQFFAFDTRAEGARLLTGSAAAHIDKELRKAGGRSVADPESFLVHDSALDADEIARAEAVGAQLAQRVSVSAN